MIATQPNRVTQRRRLERPGIVRPIGVPARPIAFLPLELEIKPIRGLFDNDENQRSAKSDRHPEMYIG